MKIKIGCHVSNNGNDMLLGSAKEAISYNANSFMVYLGAPQNSFRKPLSQLKIEEYKQVLLENNIDNENVIVHCAYILNLAQPDEEKRRYAIDFVIRELRGTHAIGAKYLVIHPGAHMKQGVLEGANRIILSLKTILEETKDIDTVICLETMSGKGTECCSKFEEIKYIMDKVNSERIKVCLDTCHIWDSGYDIVNDYENVIKQFDSIIGLENLKVIHVNDSKNTKESHKDRHENFGFGNIGFDTLIKFIFDERLEDKIKILETPYVKINDKLEVPPYKEEIEMILSKQFNPNLISEIMNK